jgi:hypothetical protein
MLDDGFLQGVERAGPDVPEHHPDRADRERERPGMVGIAGP